MSAQRKNAGLVIAGLLLGILMASMDNTIVATAMGTIVGELGGLDKFVWVTSAYMVAEMAGMPIFGKLSDMYGRKKFFVFGIIVFMLGSILCGTATSIVQLSIYRAIQGIGGGALVPIAFTIMFDAVAPESRGKLGGLFGAVFGMSSIFGPLLGAYITDYIQWEWIFYINLPLGLIAFVLVAFFYKESVEHSKQKIDWLGAAALVGAVVCLMFALELGGKEYAWDSGVILGLFAGFAVLIISFIFIERVAAEPIIKFSMFKNKLYWSSNAIAMFSGAAFITASVYIPIYIQGVFGGKSTDSGLVLLPMMLGSVVTASLGGALMMKLSFRTLMLPTLALLTVGNILLTTLGVDSHRYTVVIFMVLVGLGIGASFSVLSNAAIFSFSPQERGTASATLNFLRSLGMTIGITVFGIIQSHTMLNQFGKLFTADEKSQLPAEVNLSDPRAILAPEMRKYIPEAVLDKITNGLSYSITHTFAWAVIPSALALLFTFFMGRKKLSEMEHAEIKPASH
ncbi:EmrB/QacA subfamily drug resistance transporter [Paenibacillus cellulosilyticus]|uniref:EmrB/QacA subfamily drug resistance transporter n=1 Tax=Paenibacillus cellulosilyticus TaxID=375489 RepID=A0A2V2YWH2_9BACL|nr:DHA2 family efflux MFS transporter permease subunit [Paenibacillus cellulosilyticus]PWW05106.1 EmrB/QacA subfamily drug resistance transporter [Paenibacillus cellulosilyticus]QKS48657.1 DHA2 family efflux MFS transporter permease subunit [Paenibacillus cellulosilyticus]